MPRLANEVLRRNLAEWLRHLEACFEERFSAHPKTGLRVRRKVLIQPLPDEFTGMLNNLLDFEVAKRKEFPAEYRWEIVKKWDRTWPRLGLIRKIDSYVDGLSEFWEKFWPLEKAPRSSYTRQWIVFRNHVNAHAIVHNGREPDAAEKAHWHRKFPAVEIMDRVERGEAPRVADIPALEQVESIERTGASSARSRVKAVGIRAGLSGPLRSLENHAGIRRSHLESELEAIREGVDALYAAALASDILARHIAAKAILKRWEEKWDDRISQLLFVFGRAQYIEDLREKMPLSGAGDPGLEKRVHELRKRKEKKRLKEAEKRWEGKRTAAASSDESIEGQEEEDAAGGIHTGEKTASPEAHTEDAERLAIKRRFLRDFVG